MELQEYKERKDMNELVNENWAQSVSEIARNLSFSFKLSGWPAVATLISIPISVVLIYTIKAFATNA